MPGFNIGGSGEGPPNTVETLRQHRWRILTLGPVGARESSRLVIAQSLQLPNVNIEEQVIQGALIAYKFAKTVKWDDATVTFYDTFGLLRELETWRDEVYTDAAGIQSHSDYKQDSEFELLRADGEVDVRIRLKNSWPKNIAHGPLSYGSSDIKIITLTLSYDYAERTFPSG